MKQWWLQTLPLEEVEGREACLFFFQALVYERKGKKKEQTYAQLEARGREDKVWNISWNLFIISLRTENDKVVMDLSSLHRKINDNMALRM